MDLSCKENKLINFNRQQLTKLALYTIRTIFHNVDLVGYAKTRASKTSAKN